MGRMRPSAMPAGKANDVPLVDSVDLYGYRNHVTYILQVRQSLDLNQGASLLVLVRPDSVVLWKRLLPDQFGRLKLPFTRADRSLFGWRVEARSAKDAEGSILITPLGMLRACYMGTG